jgi:hypothetical protein
MAAVKIDARFASEMGRTFGESRCREMVYSSYQESEDFRQTAATNFNEIQG